MSPQVVVVVVVWYACEVLLEKEDHFRFLCYLRDVTKYSRNGPLLVYSKESLVLLEQLFTLQEDSLSFLVVDGNNNNRSLWIGTGEDCDMIPICIVEQK